MQNIPHNPTARALPWRGLIIVAFLALLIIAGLLGWLAWQFMLLDPRAAGALRVALFALPVALTCAAGVVGLAIAWRRWATHRYIEAHHVTALARASAQRLPAGLQHLSYTDSSRPQLAPAGEPPTVEPAPAALPGPLDLAALSLQPGGDRIVLGVDASGPIAVDVQQLCHVALLGSTGGGKSNLLRLILPQLLAGGASVVLADPHYAPLDPESGDDWRAIAARLAHQPAVTRKEIAALLGLMIGELDLRLARRRAGERVGAPMFLAFDELPSIADMLPGAVAQIGRLLREGRKVHLLTIGASQSMLIKEVGGSSALRDQYRTACYVGGDRKSAAAILDVPERLIDDGPLGKGIILLRSEVTKPPALVRVPLVSNEAIAALLGERVAPKTLDDRPLESQPSFGFRPAPKDTPSKVDGRSIESSESCSGSGISPNGDSVQKARILALFRQGKSIAEIVKELSGASGGTTYNKIKAEVEATIREAMEGVTA